MPILEVDRVSKAFWIPSERRETVREHALGLFRPRAAERLQVLNGVSFAVERGETVGIMGRNGSGKSTLLKIVSGVYEADRGAVTARAPITAILELGVGWNPELDAIDNILLIGTVMGLSLRELSAATEEILHFAELDRFAHLEVRHYSSGMAMRLAYAVAFRTVRDLLVLDEVFAVGDAGFRAKCMQRYAELRETGHTLLVVSHEPRIITSFCDRALLLEAGRVAIEGKPEEVVEAYLDLSREAGPGGPASPDGSA